MAAALEKFVKVKSGSKEEDQKEAHGRVEEIRRADEERAKSQVGTVI
jgi:hypothetical protein